MSIEELCQGDVVTKQVAAHTLGPSLDDVRTWSDVAALDCLIQTTSASESLKYSASGVQFSQIVMFSADPGLTKNHRLKWTTRAGVVLAVPIYLRVLDCYPEGIPGEDQLWIADCSYETTRSES